VREVLIQSVGVYAPKQQRDKSMVKYIQKVS
jgi:hypothetical protein